jgi:hypothetical protein
VSININNDQATVPTEKFGPTEGAAVAAFVIAVMGYYGGPHHIPHRDLDRNGPPGLQPGDNGTLVNSRARSVR